MEVSKEEILSFKRLNLISEIQSLKNIETVCGVKQ